MLAHCVFLNFADQHSTEDRMAVLRDLGRFAEGVEGVLGFQFGPNLDFESKSADHGEGFIVMFEDRAAHLRYEQHPRHIELGGRLVEMCVGGADGIVVYDLEVTR